VEKEYLKPSYTASIGAELEDGLFDGKYLSFSVLLVVSLDVVHIYHLCCVSVIAFAV
jgi:hypothetical protein